jgi:hypothetical protein
MVATAPDDFASRAWRVEGIHTYGGCALIPRWWSAPAAPSCRGSRFDSSCRAPWHGRTPLLLRGVGLALSTLAASPPPPSPTPTPRRRRQLHRQLHRRRRRRRRRRLLRARSASDLRSACSALATPSHRFSLVVGGPPAGGGGGAPSGRVAGGGGAPAGRVTALGGAEGRRPAPGRRSDSKIRSGGCI